MDNREITEDSSLVQNSLEILSLNIFIWLPNGKEYNYVDFCVVKQISSVVKRLFFLSFFFFASKALAEAADITGAAHRSWRGQAGPGSPAGYLPYPLLGVGNTVINLLFSWSGRGGTDGGGSGKKSHMLAGKTNTKTS